MPIGNPILRQRITMKPIEIVVIIAAVAIVAGVIIASVVRKLKGKPSLASDCSCCSRQGKCNGSCSQADKNVDWSELVKQRKAQLEAQKARDGASDACKCESAPDACSCESAPDVCSCESAPDVCECNCMPKACECDNQASKDGDQALQKTE